MNPESVVGSGGISPALAPATEPVPQVRNERKEVLRVADQYYVLANSVLADRDTKVLKQGETFAIFDSYGDILPVTHPEAGIFHRGTRYLSSLELTMTGGERPLLLNSTLRDDNGLLKIDMTNRDHVFEGLGFITKGTLYVHREKFLLDSKCLEQIEISNFAARDVDIDLAFRLGADFADIFEVRGSRRAQRGEYEAVRREGDTLIFAYRGLDGVRRLTSFQLSGADFHLESGADGHERDRLLRFRVRVPARGESRLMATVAFHEERETMSAETYEQGLSRIESDHAQGRRQYCGVRTTNEQFDEWMRRSTDDLVMMTTATAEGLTYPYAGIPWFCTPFGRDGILTALECLWANPSMAKGVLDYLAKTQAQEREPARDSTPGKIIHEVRDGEMAALGEIPFGRYYGSVDSTPLFVCLAGSYCTRTGDMETIRRIWPAVEAALVWLERYGDLDGDGYIEYARENPNGLVQQGWKDSSDSVFHADGSDAPGPIALCEVQGYAYMALVEGAKLADAMDRAPLARELREKAERLRENFHRDFWIEELGTYALALDGQKRACRVKSSNAGQCLFTGIVKSERVPRLVATLVAPDSFSGWGVRTVAKGAARYNPMSYHNGSVWPHDVALIAWGISKYGYKDEVEKIFNGLFRSATYMELMRMPEVFCGFERREGEAPTLYPHACSPQAWSAASVYMMVQAMLGISIDAQEKKVRLHFPVLPDSIETLKISGLTVGEGTLDVVVQNYVSDVSVQLARRSADIRVTVEK